MIYFDFSATTPVNKEVLNRFISDNESYVGNANSNHKLGMLCKHEIINSSNKIIKLLNLTSEYEIIYTSGSSEANNLAIKGLFEAKCKNYSSYHIITTHLEHSSIIAPSSYLQRKGCDVDFLSVDEKGIIDINNLISLIDDRITIVSLASVNSELGIVQPINEISKLLSAYPNVYFHVDATQSIGKIDIDLNGVDMFSFSSHKFYGLKGIGALVKKKDITLYPQIQGGKSTTKYRSGTPMHPLIMSLGNALDIAITNLNSNINKVSLLKEYFIKKICDNKNIVVNSPINAIPHVINISILGLDSSYIVEELSKRDIFISNHSACASDNILSTAVFSLTNDNELAKSSIRISISHLNTEEEIDKLIDSLKEIL